jgi:hypothetical protein
MVVTVTGRIDVITALEFENYLAGLIVKGVFSSISRGLTMMGAA